MEEKVDKIKYNMFVPFQLLRGFVGSACLCENKLKTSLLEVLFRVGGLGHTKAVRCNQESFLVVPRGPYGLQGIKPRLATCEASVLLSIQSPDP